ncbi:hypothetical protein, partial [Anaerosporobacter sp.]
KEDVKVLKEDVTVLKEDVKVLKEDVTVLKEDVSNIRFLHENEMWPAIMRIAEGHLDLSHNLERYHGVLKGQVAKNEKYDVQFLYLDAKIEELRKTQ